jgi:uncharacterized protein (TIGR02266 family)
MSGDFGEKRKSVRVPVDFQASFSKDDRDYYGQVLNLSLDGLFIKTQQLFEPQDRLNFSFKLSGSPQVLHLRGKVIWSASVDGQEDRHYGIGISFENVPVAEKLALNSFIENLLKS